MNGIVETDYGVDLMKKAFDPNAGPLSDKKATRPRRTRRCELFTGVLDICEIQKLIMIP